MFSVQFLVISFNEKCSVVSIQCSVISVHDLLLLLLLLFYPMISIQWSVLDYYIALKKYDLYSIIISTAWY